ncbi:MAG: hypothetical protein ACOYVK_21645 [Bacillota bacterium]
MTYMMSAKAFDAMNMEEVSKYCKGGCFHVTPAIKKVAIINLGMTKEELMNIINMNCSVSVFDEDFSINQLKAMECDGVFVTNGKMDANKMENVADKLKGIAGKKKLFGMGLGKDLIKMAVQEDSWNQEGAILINQKAQAYGCDVDGEKNLKELFKFI